MKNVSMLIGGQAVAAPSTFPVINPATGEAFAQVAAGNASHVDAAVAAARKAFPAWSRTADSERKAMLHGLGAALEAHMPELMELVTLETGKPLNGLNGVGAGMEVGGSIAWTPPCTGSAVGAGRDARSTFPLGVSGNSVSGTMAAGTM